MIDQPQRRSREGQYDYENMDVLCRCGHRVGDHTAEKPRECLGAHLSGDCDCAAFRRDTPSTRQHERQAARSDDGRYSEMERCELCRGPIRGGAYYSDERCNRLGRGLVLHRRCAVRVGKMGDEQMARVLGRGACSERVSSGYLCSCPQFKLASPGDQELCECEHEATDHERRE